MDARRPLHWFKSSYSGGSGTECVEVAVTGHNVLVRDSKGSARDQLAVTPRTWSEFVASIGDIPRP
ncbi:hypothetical protein GCM10010277_15390 [Streptomyces longisporoflavus]|uniref:DUF397 domain-containing protein n=1 Tax=Streptomyces longisporoflavus TaxID=28044 RepID=UPI00167CE4F3|nr:DUF397 domain-containing protein [Streptomyces longisporoflavus]GGV31589.1 hypothetical protein GCM10010277_15390 [Streptomyces longisporoflavus]